MSDECCRGRELYIPGTSETDSPAARIFSQLKLRFAVIHYGYIKAFVSDADWPTWLVRNLGLSMIPRLIFPHVDPTPQPPKLLDKKLFDPSEFTTLEKQITVPRSRKPLEAQKSNHALQDYQMQFMLLEQQNKKRLLMAREEPEQDLQYSDDFSRLHNIHMGVGTGVAIDADVTVKNTEQTFEQRWEQLKGQQAAFRGFNDPQGNRPSDNLIPPPSIGSTQKIFILSDEFTFMFRECQSSDDLRLLRDHWQHYSQWICGAHMRWQDSDFLESIPRLKTSIENCLVKSSKGSLPLRETVMPMIDPQLDEWQVAPALDISDPQHPEWALLNSFSVITQGDIHYYMRCLIMISGDHRPDINIVRYIYETVQARFKSNEGLIRYVSCGVSPFGALIPLVWHSMKGILVSFVQSHRSRQI